MNNKELSPNKMFKSCLKLKNNWVQKTKNFSWIISSLFVRSKVTQPIKKRIVHKVDWIFTLSLRLSTASLADIMALARKTTFSWLVLFVIILLIFLHCAKSLDYLDYTDCWDDLDCEEGDCCYGDILGLPGFCASCGITLRNFDGKILDFVATHCSIIPIFGQKIEVSKKY